MSIGIFFALMGYLGAFAILGYGLWVAVKGAWRATKDALAAMAFCDKYVDQSAK